MVCVLTVHSVVTFVAGRVETRLALSTHFGGALSKRGYSSRCPKTRLVGRRGSRAKEILTGTGFARWEKLHPVGLEVGVVAGRERGLVALSAGFTSLVFLAVLASALPVVPRPDEIVRVAGSHGGLVARLVYSASAVVMRGPVDHTSPRLGAAIPSGPSLTTKTIIALVARSVPARLPPSAHCGSSHAESLRCGASSAAIFVRGVHITRVGVVTRVVVVVGGTPQEVLAGAGFARR